MRKLAFAVAACVLAAAACGGGAKEERAPASTPASGGPAPAEAPANATPAEGTPAAAPEAEPGALSVAPSQSGREREAALRSARTDLERAQRDLASSLGDCAAACRALASMERATGHLCGMATAPDDRSRCEDAKAKVLAGRDRIRASCGACAGGPTLDHSAPIPSGT